MFIKIIFAAPPGPPPGHIRFSEPGLPAAFVNIKNPPGKIPVAAGQDSLEDYCLEAV